MSEPPQLGTSTAGAESLAHSTPELDCLHHHYQLAWRLCALLESIGRPTPITELASRCTQFHASLEFVKFLCSIPNSPISLAGDGCYVTVACSLSSLDLAPDVAARPIRDSLDLFRKRKSENDEEEELKVMPFSKRIRSKSEGVHCPEIDGKSWAIVTEANDMSALENGSMLGALMDFESCALLLKGNSLEHHVTLLQNGVDPNAGERASYGRELLAVEHNTWPGSPTCIFGHQIVTTSSVDFIGNKPQDAVPRLEVGGFNPPQTLDQMIVATSSVDISPRFQNEESQQDAACPLGIGDAHPLEELACNTREIGGFNLFENGNANDPSKTVDEEIDKNKLSVEGREKDMDPCQDGETQTLFLQSNIVAPVPTDNEFIPVNIVDDTDDMLSLSHNPPKPEDHATCEFLAASNEQPFATMVAPNTFSLNKTQDLCKTFGSNKVAGTSPLKQYCRRSKTSACRSQKQKQHNGVQLKHQKGQHTSLSSNDHPMKNMFPDFDSYIIEEEEGSGGYGIVYKALRKSDGTKVAIKCPHADAQKHHVYNELRMLERFGGKNFIIKYEGCLKSGNSDCFVLKHVEHDRPELLKREITVDSLQWYGYCMFRALASLHKEGVVHRDVKPGNFLFSRRTNKGYLIDFNLALDLHWKYKATDKCKMAFDFAHVTSQSPRSELPIASKKHTVVSKSSKMANCLDSKRSRSTLRPNTVKKAVGRIRPQHDLSGWDRFNSHGTDGSGITSAKDLTSTKNNPSCEKKREPLPCHGRKELINFLQETMSGLNHEAPKAPASMRKRVAAVPAKPEEEFLYPTPMPLRSNNRPVAGAGLTSKVDGIQKKDGPCAGTKGFRAPEVCFRSAHQSPKIDIWSAGVTLLYLMVGRTPFSGDPEQNIKEIAKLKGSEDLWEVAKLHNRESSFPEELYNTGYLQSMDLREWCRMNTKRKDFLEAIPGALFDVVDKCLTVNPRLRISAEEALKHEFFYPIQESLRKQRLLKPQKQNATASAAPRTTHDTLQTQNIKENLEVLS